MTRPFSLRLLLALIVVAVTGCGPFVDSWNIQDHADEVAGRLGNGSIVAQTFSAGCPGLSAIDLQIAVYPDVPPSSGSLVVSLYPQPTDTTVTNWRTQAALASASFPEASLVSNQWIRFPFPPVEDSENKTFAIVAWTTDAMPSPVTLWATGHAVALAGTRYLQDQVKPGRFVFRAYCNEPPLLVAHQVLTLVSRSGWLWPVELFLCCMPGLLVVTWLDQEERDLTAFLGLAIGWSVLLAPLGLALLTPFHLGTAALPAFGGLGLFAFLWRRPRLRVGRSALVGLVACAVALPLRVIAAKDLVLPMWSDSVQHSYIVDLILQRRGLPVTYGLAMPNEVFDYHFGFHTLAASGAWLTGTSAAEAVLATGQILNGLICLTMYRFARDLIGSARAGAVAALLVGLVTTQPAYFVSWGRYTELAGLVALPAAAAALKTGLDSKGKWWQFSAAATAASAMILVHPRVAVFLAGFALAVLVTNQVDHPSLRRLIGECARLLTMGGMSLLLVSPWVLRLWHAHSHQVTASFPWQTFDFPWDLATGGADYWIVRAAGLGLLVALLLRPSLAFLLVVWAAPLVIITNPATFHLPFFLFLNNGSLAIAVFVPATILTAYLAEVIATGARVVQWPTSARWATVALLLAGSLSRANAQATVLNPCCMLARPQDLAAINWVRDHTPPDARFLIEGNPWDVNSWFGSDAGYWLPVLAHRWVSIPPLFYATATPDQAKVVNTTASLASQVADDPAALAQLARQIGARYVFVGTRGGDFDPENLVKSGYFRVVFRDGAWVLELASDRATERVAGPGIVEVITDEGAVGTSNNSTVTVNTPVAGAPPRASKAAGLRSRTPG